MNYHLKTITYTQFRHSADEEWDDTKPLALSLATYGSFIMRLLRQKNPKLADNLHLTEHDVTNKNRVPYRTWAYIDANWDLNP
jgi:hypothetical protein